MGDSCIEEPPKESNPDFMQAAMALNMASWATNDQDCSTGSCYVFKGDGYSCKTAFFGVQDCCQTPTGLSIASYITAIYYTYKMSDKAAIMKFMDSNGMGAAVDAYKGIADWTTATYDKISTAVTTNVQSVLGTAGGPGAAPTLSATFSQLESQMISQLYDWTSSAFGPALADSLFGAPGAGAAGSGVASGPAAEFASTGAGQAIQMVGTVFMYYQMFVLAVQMIWPCEPREFELAVKKEMRSCHELGDFCASSFLGICYLTKKSFCCFKSPLARIINEQLRLHGATPWAAPSDQPSCPGVSMADFAVIDWSQIDLSEWVALLQTSNLMPTGAASADALYNMQKITTNQTVSGPQGTGALDKSTIGMSTAQPSDATQYVRGSLWGPLP
jgi:conjugal transfer mating pair stabilization protein TraN